MPACSWRQTACRSGSTSSHAFATYKLISNKLDSQRKKTAVGVLSLLFLSIGFMLLLHWGFPLSTKMGLSQKHTGITCTSPIPQQACILYAFCMHIWSTAALPTNPAVGLGQKHTGIACTSPIPQQACNLQALSMHIWSAAALPTNPAVGLGHGLTLDDVVWDPRTVVGRGRWWTTPPLTLWLLILFSLICWHKRSWQVTLIVTVAYLVLVNLLT